MIGLVVIIAIVGALGGLWVLKKKK